MTFDKVCPCGSQLTYLHCCGVYHSGKQNPLTALDLMRSRFSAFALQNSDYLLKTWDDNTKPAALDLRNDPSIWRELKIVKNQKGAVTDVTGQVEFKAYYELQGEQYLLHELSRFKKQQERWFYIDGIVKASGLIVTNDKQRKNALCLCGSGKKYKRCCGASQAN